MGHNHNSSEIKSEIPVNPTVHYQNYIQVECESEIEFETESESEFEPKSSIDIPDLSYVNTSSITPDLNTLNSHSFLNNQINHISPCIYGIPIIISHHKSYNYDDVAFTDSGAQRSLVKLSLFNKIKKSTKKPNRPQLLKTRVVLKSISGDKLIVYGKTIFQVFIEQIPYFCDFMVVEDNCCTFPGNILLGCDNLSKIPLILDYSEKLSYLKHKGKLLPIPLIPITNKINQTACVDKMTVCQNSPDFKSANIFNSEPKPKKSIQDYFSNSSIDDEFLPTLSNQSLSQLPKPQTELHSVIQSSGIKKNYPIPNNPIYCANNLVIDDSILYKVYTTEYTKILPHSKYIIRTKVESDIHTYPPDNLTLLTENRKDFRNIGSFFIGSILSNCNNGCILLECINLGNNVIHLDPHTYLTTASPIIITEPITNSSSTSNSSSINSVSTSKNLSDSEIRNVYKEILLSHSAKSSDTYVLQNPQQLDDMLDFLVKHRNIISLENDPVGLCPLVQFTVKLKDDSPSYIYTPPYRHPHKYLQAIDDWVEDNLSKGYIEPSSSPFSSPLLVIPKKSSSKMRIVLDYRKLNAVTVPDRFPLPNIQESLSLIGNSKVFSTIDLLSGFTHIMVEKESRKYLAFSTTRGHFEPIRMPQGTTNSPSVFSRAMEMALSGLLGLHCLLFIDDCLVFSKSIDDHYESLTKVFHALQKANLRIKLEKCEFFKNSVTYLGFKISEKGLSPDPVKLEALKGFKIPTNVSETRSLLGFFNYFRHLIPNYSHIAHPLTQLLKKNVPFSWNIEQQSAYDKLKKLLLLDPSLSFPDYTKPFILSVDASNYGVGAVLAQLNEEGLEKPIAFTSRLLNKAERNYSTTEREALAIIHALSKFRTIILGYNLKIYTDHSALVHLFRHRQLTGRLERWNLRIQSFNPEFVYKKGKLNIVPDYLSRHPAPNVSDINSVLNISSLNTKILNLTEQTIFTEQRKCPRLSPLIKWYETLPNERLGAPHLIINGLLYYVTNDNRYLLQVPDSLIYTVLYLNHHALGSGHPGHLRTEKRIRELYTFPKLSQLCKQFCKECSSCLEIKGNKPHPISISTYPLPFQPFSRVHLDTVGPLPKCKNTNNRYILVFKDSLTRYTELCPVPSREAKYVAKALLERIITNHSTPSILITDSAAEFKSQFFLELCKLWRIKKANITIYHPSSNSLVERENRNIENYLRNYVNSNHNDWDKYLPFCQIALNSSYNTSIGNTPHFLLHHYVKRLPYSIPDYVSPFVHNKSSNQGKDFIHDYTAEMFERSSAIRELSRDKLKAETTKIAQRQHQNAPNRHANIGDRVYILAIKPANQSPKLAKRWQGPYLVTNILKFGKYILQCLETGKQFVCHIDNFKIVSYPKLTVPENSLKSCIKASANPSSSRKRVSFQSDVTNPSDFHLKSRPLDLPFSQFPSFSSSVPITFPNSRSEFQPSEGDHTQQQFSTPIAASQRQYSSPISAPSKTISSESPLSTEHVEIENVTPIQPTYTSPSISPTYQSTPKPLTPKPLPRRNISNISTPSSYSPYSPYYSPQHTTPQSILNKDYSSDLSDITNKSSTPPLPFEQTDKSLSDVSSSPPLRDDRDIDPSYKPYQFYKGPRDNTPIQTRSRTRLQNQELIKQNPDIPTFSYELYRDNDSYTSLPTLPPNQNSNNIQTSTPTSSRDNNKPDERTGAIPKIRKDK